MGPITATPHKSITITVVGADLGDILGTFIERVTANNQQLTSIVGLLNQIQTAQGVDRTTITAVLDKIQELKIMQKQQFDDIISALDTATTKAGAAAQTISNDITALKAQIQGAGLSEADEADILAKLTTTSNNLGALADSLTQMGTDNSNPVPTPVPTPTPVDPNPPSQPSV